MHTLSIHSLAHPGAIPAPPYAHLPRGEPVGHGSARRRRRGEEDVSIRRLDPSEAEALAAHLLRLDPDTRRLRFGNAVNDVFLASYARTAFGAGSCVTGCFIGGTLRGVAELRPMAAAGEAEAAFSLEAAFQGRGLGSRLFAAAVAEAGELRLSRLHLSCLRENRRIQSLVRRHGGRIRFSAGEAQATIDGAAAMISGPTFGPGLSRPPALRS